MSACRRSLAALILLLFTAACAREEPPVQDPRAEMEAVTVGLRIVGEDAQGPFVSRGAGTLLHEAGYVIVGI